MAEEMNLSRLCSSLSLALSTECSPISERKLQELFIARAVESGCADLQPSDAGDVFVSTVLMFGIYADWITDIGAALGFACQADDSAGAWITDDMQATTSITKAIRKMAVGGLASLDERLREQLGFSATDVLVQSIHSGEPLEQSHARLHSSHRGLSRVKTER